MNKVIFDTNAYRYLSTGKTIRQLDKLVQRIKKKEQENDIETMFSPVVAKELLAHVADSKDPSFNKCLKAIRAMYLHNGDEKEYKMIASVELLIAKAFFNTTIPRKEETNRAIGAMIYSLAMNPDKKTLKKHNTNLQLNKAHVEGSELEFAKSLFQLIHKIDPDAKGWQIHANDEKKRRKALTEIRSESTSLALAMSYIILTYSLLLAEGRITEIAPEKLFEMGKILMAYFPEPIALYKQVLENIINTEFNLFEESRTNFIWDIHLMFNVGKHSIQKANVIFVTSDKAMIQAATKANGKFTVYTFEEYMDFLGLGSKVVRKK